KRESEEALCRVARILSGFYHLATLVQYATMFAFIERILPKNLVRPIPTTATLARSDLFGCGPRRETSTSSAESLSRTLRCVRIGTDTNRLLCPGSKLRVSFVFNTGE